MVRGPPNYAGGAPPGFLGGAAAESVNRTNHAIDLITRLDLNHALALITRLDLAPMMTPLTADDAPGASACGFRRVLASVRLAIGVIP